MSEQEAQVQEQTAAESAASEQEAPTAAVADGTDADSATAEGESEEIQQPDGPKKPSRKDRRFDVLTARAKRAEAESAELRRKLAEQESATKAAAPTRAKPTQADTNSDGSLKYATYEDYIEDLADWKAEQRLASHTAEQQKAESERKAKEKLSTLEASYHQRIDAAREKYADFDEIALAKDSPIAAIPEGSAMDAYILNSEQVGDLLYHLAQNPDDIERIAALQPMQQVAELAKLEVRLASAAPDTDEDEEDEDDAAPAAKPQKPAAPVSKAPPPVQPVRKSGPQARAFNPNDPRNDTELTDEQWLAKRNAELAKRRGR